MISVVIPLKKAAENPYVEQNLALLKEYSAVQVIPVIAADKSRAVRINDGIEQAKHKMILIVHPRSLLTANAIEWLLQNADKKIWGGFSHKFDFDHPLLQFTSWYSNEVRGKKRGIVYLDHCIFLHKDILGEARPVPEVEIFEDTLLSEKLRKKQKPMIPECQATTSAIRFKQNGVAYQSLVNQILKVAYYLGASDKVMNRIYEKGLNLN